MYRQTIFRFGITAWVTYGLLGGLLPAQPLKRMENTTLRFPQSPPFRDYSTIPAFPGLSLSQPLCIATIPGETNRLFVVERAGRIIAVTNLASPSTTVVLDIASKVATLTEGGMLGLAFHPHFASNGFLFVAYSTMSNSNGSVVHSDRLSRFQWATDGSDIIDKASETPLITQQAENDQHRGGDVHFGPDEYLYWSRGDGGNAARNAQSIDRDFFACLLRLDVNNQPGGLPPNPHPSFPSGYRVPNDNPFIGTVQFNGLTVDPSAVRTEIFATGLRNPWRFSFDPITGWLYCGDVGQENLEELDIITKGGNFGWNYFEGTRRHSSPPDGHSLIPPIWQYLHLGPATNQGRAIVGGIVYRGTRFADLYGDYLFGDYSSSHVWALHYDGNNVSNFRRLTSAPSVVSFAPDPRNGDVLIVRLDGNIDRLTYSGTATGDPLPASLDQTGAFADLRTLQPAPGIQPYSINTPFWSDHAIKSRWFSVPQTNQFLGFDANLSWSYPTGTVWIKHFDLELTNGVAESRRRLETRFLIRNPAGVYGLTYRWGDEQTNALLVAEEGMDETFNIHDGTLVRTQTWHYPSRSECIVCHSSVGGLALGFNTAQLNCNAAFGNVVTNQILGLAAMGYFTNGPANTNGLPAMAPATDEAVPLETRARSFLASNCAQCHQPGGSGRGMWDARFSTAIEDAGILNGGLIENHGDAANRVVAPGDIAHSAILTRLSDMGPLHMPPLGTSVVNTQAVALLTRWIAGEPKAEFISSTLGPDGVLTFHVSGHPQRRYRVQVSTDLLSWVDRAEILADSQGSADFVTPTSGRGEFFRVVWP